MIRRTAAHQQQDQTGIHKPRKAVHWLPNVCDQRRRALGAPLADRTFPKPPAISASGVPTRDDRCIA
jgi:hypothetical protein